jgi:hypothetical protein
LVKYIKSSVEKFSSGNYPKKNMEVFMPFRVTLDGAHKGAKFDTKEEAIDSMWMFYEDKMSRADFEKMINDHIEEV